MSIPVRLSLLLVACLLALSGCSGTAEGLSEGAGATPSPTASAELTDLPGVDMSSLTPEQRRQALKLFQESTCDCSCGMTIAVCRVDDPDCGRSPELAADVIRLMAEGKTVDQAAAAVFHKAAASEMVFDVPVGETFFDGPPDAAVTLITFLDYQ